MLKLTYDKTPIVCLFYSLFKYINILLIVSVLIFSYDLYSKLDEPRPELGMQKYTQPYVYEQDYLQAVQ